MLPAIMFAPIVFGVLVLLSSLAWGVLAVVLRAVGIVRSDEWAVYACAASDALGALLFSIGYLIRRGAGPLRSVLIGSIVWIWAVGPLTALALLFITNPGS